MFKLKYKKGGFPFKTNGEGFMNPPYRSPEGKGPREKRQGWHGFKNFTSILEKGFTPTQVADSFAIAPDGTKHTGQVSDYEIEKKEDEKRNKKN